MVFSGFIWVTSSAENINLARKQKWDAAPFCKILLREVYFCKILTSLAENINLARKQKWGPL